MKGEYFNARHAEALEALEKLKAEYEQLQRWHRESIKESPKPSRAMHDLAENMARAAKKHPGPHANIMVTLGVLSQEMHELQDAVHSREERSIRAELLDVATSALRGVEALDERAEARRAARNECVACASGS